MKINLKYALICTILAGGSIFTSCEKDEITIDESLKNKNHNLKIEETIIDFRKRMTSSNNLKTGQTIFASDAVDQVEGSFNYFYGFPSENYSETFVTTFNVSFEYQNESIIQVDELQELYKKINNNIYDVFTDCKYHTKRLKLVDLEILEDIDSLLVKICIGNLENRKSATWLGVTPYNSQQNKKWMLGEIGWTNNSYGPSKNTEVAIELNSAITLPLQGSNVYIYVVQNTGWLDSPVDYQSIYIPNPSIASPTEENSSFFNLVGYVENDVWHYGQSTPNGQVPHSGNADYRFMNKYYNVCKYTIEKYRPNNKEAVLFEFASNIYDYFDQGNHCRWLNGVTKVTYASKYPRGILPPPDDQPGNPRPL